MADTTSPAAPSRTRPTPTRLIRVSTMCAWLAVLLFASSAAFFTLPVDDPGVQHCGAPGMYLIHGTEDAPLYDNQGNAINHWNQRQVEAAYKHRCSQAVANQAVPAAMLAAAFVIVGLVALILSFAGHRLAQASDLAAWTATRSPDQVGRTTNSGVSM